MSDSKFSKDFAAFNFDALTLEVEPEDRQAFEQFLRQREEQFENLIKKNPIFYDATPQDPLYKKTRKKYLGTLLNIDELLRQKFK